MDLLIILGQNLALPLLRLLATMSVGILLANTLEALAWDRHMARLAAPLVRMGRMGPDASSSFVTAFFSAHSSTGILTNAYAEGRIGKKELVLSNLFNSFPSYLMHLPNVAAMAIAILGKWGIIYIGLGLFAALLRTLGTAVAGHFILPALQCENCALSADRACRWRDIAHKIFGTFKKRLLRMFKLTVPIYIIFFFIQHFGGFAALEHLMTGHMAFFSFLKPEALSIVAMNLATETTASMSAAAALLHAGTLSGRDIVLTMLLGNILSSPVRAVRHQLPVYAGYFPSGVAVTIVICNQGVRTLSLLLVLFLYYFW